VRIAGHFLARRAIQHDNLLDLHNSSTRGVRIISWNGSTAYDLGDLMTHEVYNQSPLAV